MAKPDQPYWIGHRGRLREKARSVGVEALRPYEMVELILYQSDLRADMAEVARALIGRFGTVNAVLSASREELMAVPGVKRQAADWLVRTGALVDRFRAADAQPQLRIWRERDLEGYLRTILRDVRAPQTWMLYTDYEDDLLMCSVLCDSLGWADPMIAQAVIQEALAMNARRAFLVCFMGSEPPQLEDNEREFLASLAATLEAVGVTLLDCMLVSKEAFYSMNKSGQMDRVRQESSQPWLHERYAGEEDYIWKESPNSCG